jgi:hypothetical protein
MFKSIKMNKLFFLLFLASLVQNCDQGHSIIEEANEMGEHYCKCMRQRLKKEEFRYAVMYCESKSILVSPDMLSHYVELRFWNQPYPLMPKEEKEKADEFWEQFCHYTDCNCYKESRVNYWRNNKLENGTKH